ncbi:hypothetical protein [Engelhardtia mirabilis]|uniref:Uncharacterized protein n=1 Tax=Engelhardtia mirabilis TaxID=2528011 RepID=A0A518BHT6_9BACT|nr:hypothetical protein Pla133_16140 [Planctomycetes bacterium Pla133]QDV00864.1 hypothetical protein Pla86_16130 [Planctomycetes bacterium Pla86]
MRTKWRVVSALGLVAFGAALGVLLTKGAGAGGGEAPHPSAAGGPEPAGNVELAGLTGALRAPSGPEPAADEPEASVAPTGPAWISDGSQIRVRGRTMEDVMRDWHGADWPLVEEVVLRSLNDPENIGLDRPLERDSLGDMDGCLERAPELALKWYDNGPAPVAIKRFPGSHVPSTFPAELLARRLVREPFLFPGQLPSSPAAADVDMEHPDWDAFVQWLAGERETFLDLGNSLIEAQRTCIRETLEATTRFERPAHGELYFAPFITPHSPQADPQDPAYEPPNGIVLLIGEGNGPCGMFGGIYYLSFREVPAVAGILADWRAYSAILSEELLARVEQLPLL